MRGQFNRYVKQITGHLLAFNKAEKASIQLMHTLQLNGAPLDAYNKIMMWHLKSSGLAHEYETGTENRPTNWEANRSIQHERQIPPQKRGKATSFRVLCANYFA